jgi:hypothetical protein
MQTIISYLSLLSFLFGLKAAQRNIISKAGHIRTVKFEVGTSNPNTSQDIRIQGEL